MHQALAASDFGTLFHGGRDPQWQADWWRWKVTAGHANAVVLQLEEGQTYFGRRRLTRHNDAIEGRLKTAVD